MWRCFLRVEVLDECGRASGSVVDVEDATFALGSDGAQSNVVLPHEDIAAVHARIDVDPENPAWHVFVRPAGPAAALRLDHRHHRHHRSHRHAPAPAPVTVLNGAPLWRPQPLHRGDVLSLGPFDVALADAGVVLHTGERLSLCAAGTREDAAAAPLRDARVRAEAHWLTETVLHCPHACP